MPQDAWLLGLHADVFLPPAKTTLRENTVLMHQDYKLGARTMGLVNTNDIFRGVTFTFYVETALPSIQRIIS